MFRNKLYGALKLAKQIRRTSINIKPLCISLLPVVFSIDKDNLEESLSHEFFLRQATTVNVNAATQLLTVTVVAIQDISERLQESLSKEIALLKQAIEWGDATPAEHWDQLIEVRGTLDDLKFNLGVLYSYMEYAERLATTAAELSYLSGNMVASDAISERIEFASKTCRTQKILNNNLQTESLALQQKAIINAPHLEDKLAPEMKAKLKKR